tara:strand:- start:814 stop:963 length:150 start_codon:yes stop_codon:yes gene_type:complete
MEWIASNWEVVLIGILVIDKVVALSPTPYDDMLWSSIKGIISKSTGKKI